MLFLTRPASLSSQVRWKCLFEVLLLLTFPPGCKLQLLLDYTDSGSEKETWQMMCGTMPTFKARPATFPDVIFFTLHPPQQWGAKREERGEKTASQTVQKACSSKEKKNHTHQHEISNVALMLHWYTNKGIFLSSGRMFFFPSRWCVIIYILPKMRICGCCCIYTNSDLQGGYRWQILRLCGRLDKSLEEWSQLI